jgi:hypothetical protein
MTHPGQITAQRGHQLTQARLHASRRQPPRTKVKAHPGHGDPAGKPTARSPATRTDGPLTSHPNRRMQPRRRPAERDGHQPRPADATPPAASRPRQAADPPDNSATSTENPREHLKYHSSTTGRPAATIHSDRGDLPQAKSSTVKPAAGACAGTRRQSKQRPARPPGAGRRPRRSRRPANCTPSPPASARTWPRSPPDSPCLQLRLHRRQRLRRCQVAAVRIAGLSSIIASMWACRPFRAAGRG